MRAQIVVVITDLERPAAKVDQIVDDDHFEPVATVALHDAESTVATAIFEEVGVANGIPLVQDHGWWARSANRVARRGQRGPVASIEDACLYGDRLREQERCCVLQCGWRRLVVGPNRVAAIGGVPDVGASSGSDVDGGAEVDGTARRRNQWRIR